MNYPKAVLKAQKAEDVIEIDPARLVEFDRSSMSVFDIRGSGKLNKHAVWLAYDYEWIIAQDESGELCAIPLKKI